MKRLLSLLLISLLLLTGCGSPALEAASPAAVPATSAEAATAAAEPASSTEPQAAAQTGSFVDLTVLSSTMVYAEVFNMTTFPEDYIGKTVKMRGQFSTGKLYAQDGSDGGMVFACIIQDATSCCAQGIPFDLAGSFSYPEDYPQLGDQITVVGTFEKCTQDGLEFYRLSQAEMVEA